MTHKIKQILTATLAILIVASISACTDNATNSSTSKTSSEVTSSVPETSVTDTSVPETTVHTEDTSVETPKPETTVQIVTETPETSSVPETEAPKPETTVTTTTTTVATTKPAPEWTETKASGTKYVNTSCYSRKKAVLGAETVKLYSVNDKVTVTAKTDTGYFKLSDGSFIHSDYLSDSKVTVPATTTTKTTSSTTPSSSGAAYGSKEYVVNLCKQYGFVELSSTPDFNNPMLADTAYYDYENVFIKVKNNANGRRICYTLKYDSVYNIYGVQLSYEQPSIAWTESDVFYVFSEVKKYADSVGFTNYDFPTKIEHFKDEFSFGGWGSYRVTGRVWVEGLGEEYLLYPCSSKEENINYFIGIIKKTIDNRLNGTAPDDVIDSVLKYTVTTGKDMLKFFEANGWTTDGQEIGNCDVDTAFVFISNH